MELGPEELGPEELEELIVYFQFYSYFVKYEFNFPSANMLHSDSESSSLRSIIPPLRGGIIDH